MHIICSKSPSSLVKNLAKILNAKLTQHIIKSFSNQEFFINLKICCKKVLIEFPKYHSANDSILDLAITLDAVWACRPESIDLLIPHIPYSRQDKRNHPGDSLGIKVIADILNNFEINKIITFDLHSEKSIAFFNAKIINLTPDIIFSEYLTQHNPSDIMVLATDGGGAKRGKLVADLIGCKCIIPTKCRVNNEIIHYLDLQAINKLNIVIIDDIIDSGKTIISLLDILSQASINSIYIYATHILNIDAIEIISSHNLVRKIYISTEITQTCSSKIKSVELHTKLANYF